VDACLCLCVCGWLCYHNNSKLRGFVGKDSDHLQLIKFWPSRALGRAVCGGAKIFRSTLLQPARSVCVFAGRFFHYRQDAAKRQTAGIKFTHRPKIRLFATQGRLVAPIQVKLGKADGHVVLSRITRHEHEATILSMPNCTKVQRPWYDGMISLPSLERFCILDNCKYIGNMIMVFSVE